MPTTVLIADDSNFARIQIKKLAEEAGYKVVAEAANGEEAVSHYKSIHPDVVTMDLSMPVKDGMQAIKEIIDFDNNAVIIVCSSLGNEEKTVAEAVLAGARDVMVKPISRSQIVAAVERQLARKRVPSIEDQPLRQFHRFGIQDLQVRYKIQGNFEWNEGIVTNISKGGVLLQMRETLPENSNIMIELSGVSSKLDDAVVLVGKTVWNKQGQEKSGTAEQEYGVEFVELTRREQFKLQEIIETNLTKEEEF